MAISSGRHPFRKTLFAVALGALLAGCGGETTTDDPTLSLLDGAPGTEADLPQDNPPSAIPEPVLLGSTPAAEPELPQGDLPPAGSLLSMLAGEAPVLEIDLPPESPLVADPAPAPVPEADPDAGPAPVMAVRTVTPSLGQVFSGTVRVIAPGGGGLEVAELARGQTGHDGSADLDVPADAEGPFIVEVSGNETATYYDEGTDQQVALNDTDVIRALVLDLPEGGLGVTPLTELAVRYLEETHGNLLDLGREQLLELFTSGAVDAAYARIRDELAPELGELPLTSAPTVVGNASDLAALGTAGADLYALKLAALARVGSLNDLAGQRPALAILRDLGEDLADGVFDGRRGAEALVAPTYDINTFAAQLNGAAQQLAASEDLRNFVGSLERYVSAFVSMLGAAAAGDDDDPVDIGDILDLRGDLLASWTGNFHGGWNVELLEAWVYVPAPTWSSPFRWEWQRDVITEGLLRVSMSAMTFGSNECNWVVNTGNIRFGHIDIPFGAAYAAAAEGEARSYTLPVSLTVLDYGVTATTTMNTQGVLPTRIALDYNYDGPLKRLRYKGACTFSYES